MHSEKAADFQAAALRRKAAAAEREREAEAVRSRAAATARQDNQTRQECEAVDRAQRREARLALDFKIREDALVRQRAREEREHANFVLAQARMREQARVDRLEEEEERKKPATRLEEIREAGARRRREREAEAHAHRQARKNHENLLSHFNPEEAAERMRAEADSKMLEWKEKT